jgi:exo-beta-1,3-glucanase (GH17 family)
LVRRIAFPVFPLRAALLGICCTLLACASAGLQAAPACAAQPNVRAALARLGSVMRAGRFVAYEPTSLRVLNGAVTPANPDSIRADLTVLRQKFDGLITYGALHGADQIPSIASGLGFRAMVVGVWDPSDDSEVSAAVASAARFPDLVAGISLGNETLFYRRSDRRRLAAALAAVRTRLPAVALTTTEPFHVFESADTRALLSQLDFLLVNVHPVFQPWFRQAPDATAAQFVVNVVRDLGALSCGPILVKETGEPSAPAAAGYSEARQASFYRELRQRLIPDATHAFAYFAAFDAPWRELDAGPAGTHPEEAHWGLYGAARAPKAAARELPLLRPAR